MRLPCEIVVNELLPLLRKSIAERLNAEGYTQMQIAHQLSVSQPAVSYYLKQETSQSRYESKYVEMKSNALADSIIAGDSDSTIIRDICELCMSLRTFGSTCRFHREQIKLEDDCTACIVNVPLTLHSEKEEVLNDLRSGIERLENSPETTNLIPEVSIQFVRSIKNAKRIDEVASVPGRIVKVKGRLKRVENPEFGTSNHTARLLLAIIQRNPQWNINAAICIRYDNLLQSVFDSMNIVNKQLIIESTLKDQEANVDVVIQAIENQLLNETPPEIIIDPGGEGREPIAYIIGSTAIEVAMRAINIAKRISN